MSATLAMLRPYALSVKTFSKSKDVENTGQFCIFRESMGKYLRRYVSVTRTSAG